MITGQAVQIESRNGYCSCGEALVQTYPATMSAPAEWECPVCDGGHVRSSDRPYPADAFDVEYERARARGWED